MNAVICFLWASAWLIAGTCEAITVVSHAKHYKYSAHLRYWQSAIYWFVASAVGYIAGIVFLFMESA